MYCFTKVKGASVLCKPHSLVPRKYARLKSRNLVFKHVPSECNVM
jgi:hypothetical protein